MKCNLSEDKRQIRSTEESMIEHEDRITRSVEEKESSKKVQNEGDGNEGR